MATDEADESGYVSPRSARAGAFRMAAMRAEQIPNQAMHAVVHCYMG
jgi:hypothetical protein